MINLKIPFYQDVGLLLIRIGVGSVFVVHGWWKWQNLSSASEFFINNGIPGWMVYVVAATELVGGLCVLFGWLARFFSVGLAIIMVVAIATVKFDAGFMGGYEFELVLLLMSLAISFAGAGRYKLRVINWGNNQIE